MKAQAYQDIEKVLINEPVSYILETALICLQAKKRRNERPEYHNPMLEAECDHGIRKLELALKSLEKKFNPTKITINVWASPK